MRQRLVRFANFSAHRGDSGPAIHTAWRATRKLIILVAQTEFDYGESGIPSSYDSRVQFPCDSSDSGALNVHGASESAVPVALPLIPGYRIMGGSRA